MGLCHHNLSNFPVGSLCLQTTAQHQVSLQTTAKLNSLNRWNSQNKPVLDKFKSVLLGGNLQLQNKGVFVLFFSFKISGSSCGQCTLTPKETGDKMDTASAKRTLYIWAKVGRHIQLGQIDTKWHHEKREMAIPEGEGWRQSHQRW